MIEHSGPIDQPFLDHGEWTVEIADKRYPVRCSLKPLYDPDMKKIKC
jgi:4-methylaminobutanoate oxidase (formaldehyde-forming)